MRCKGDRQRRVDPSQLLDHDRVSDRVGTRTAVLLRDRHPHQPEVGKLRDEVVREPLLEVELGCDRSHAFARERAHGLADELLLLGEVEVQAARRDASSAISRTP